LREYFERWGEVVDSVVMRDPHSKRYHCHKFTVYTVHHRVPSVLCHCWLGGRKGIWPVKKWGNGVGGELQTFRTQNLSFPRTKGPYGGTKVPGPFHSRALSFLGPFVLGNFRSWRAKVPPNFRSWDLSYMGTFVPILCALVYNSSLGVVIV